MVQPAASAPPTPTGASTPHGVHSHPSALGPLTLAALGVVYGDIGTSPLYTLRECVTPPHGVAVSLANPEPLFGVLSLIFWSLMMVVTIKYLTFIMRADNGGEGGILALLALIPEKLRVTRRAGSVTVLALLVIAGAGLLYGDGIITPAISVLSASEGLKVATPSLAPAVLPITIAILVALFAIQRRGTGGIGRLFGPIMVVWFGTIAVLGVIQIVRHPGILAAISPVHAVRLFVGRPGHSFRLLGSVVLAVTGGEALYADMGHFGRKPIRIAWLGLVLPALLLSYFGQGALILRTPAAAADPFFRMVPHGAGTYALVVLAACATVIASQALISGAFSLTHQAVQLGYFPRVTVRHTAHEQEGQIYIPEINWTLAAACIALVLAFRESTRIAAAYGIAVTGTMAITSIVYYVVVRRTWGWPQWKALPLLVLFLAFDLPFFGANALKFRDGGWVPVLIAFVFFTAMVVWKVGRSLLGEYMQARSPTWEKFLEELDQNAISRVAGTAVFMSSSSRVPPGVLHHARRIRVLHEHIVLCTIDFRHVPYVDPAGRLDVVELGHGFRHATARYGFMETPDVPALMKQVLERLGLPDAPADLTYYLGRETFLATDAGKMGRISESIFAFLSRNARSATAYFGIPPEQVIELGTQIDL